MMVPDYDEVIQDSEGEEDTRAELATGPRHEAMAFYSNILSSVPPSLNTIGMGGAKPPANIPAPHTSHPNASDKPSTVSEFSSSIPREQQTSVSHISSFTATSLVAAMLPGTSSPIVSSRPPTSPSSIPAKPRPKPRRKIPKPKDVDTNATTEPAGPSVPRPPSPPKPSARATKVEFIVLSSSDNETELSKPKKSRPAQDPPKNPPAKRRRVEDSDAEDDPLRLSAVSRPSGHADPPVPPASLASPNVPTPSAIAPSPEERSTLMDVDDQVAVKRKVKSKKPPADGEASSKPKKLRKPKTDTQAPVKQARPEQSTIAPSVLIELGPAVEPEAPATATKKRKAKDKKLAKSSKKIVLSDQEDDYTETVNVAHTQRSSIRVAIARSTHDSGTTDPTDGESEGNSYGRGEKPPGKQPGKIRQAKKRSENSEREVGDGGDAAKEDERGANAELSVAEDEAEAETTRVMRMVVEIPTKPKRPRKVAPEARNKSISLPEHQAEPEAPTPHTEPREDLLEDRSEPIASHTAELKETPAPVARPNPDPPRPKPARAVIETPSAKSRENSPRGLASYRRPNKPLPLLLNQSYTPVRPSGLSKSVKIAPLHANRKVPPPALPKPKEAPKKKAVDGEDDEDGDGDHWGEKRGAKLKRLMREFEALEGMEGKKADEKRKELLEEVARLE